MNIVEGYVVNPENKWCNPFALGEPKYSTKVNFVEHFNHISPHIEIPSSWFLGIFISFCQVRQKQRERAESLVVATNNTES